ncbi:hypothetical protein RN001_000313 [Aquatica leii]|uniref:Uncharacterized protein n=1 Tax=Aquatica leii TaxID=1421715 RepID=A0AAN7SJ43_9COLE|nr:hypothetical protein RN001_000313 [Aquatica leii]
MEEDGQHIPKYDNIYLRSCEKEVTIPIDGKITGSIPLWLNGALLRNGPGLLKVGNYEFKHLFDGMALLQRFEIKNGKVTFQCRFLQSNAYKTNTRANRIMFTDFGTTSTPDPCQSIFQRFFSVFQRTKTCDNANISLYPFGDEIYSLGEMPFMFKIDKDTLETKERKNLHKLNIVCHTSHPQVTEDGTVYNLAISKTVSNHSIVRFPKKSTKYDDDYSMYDKAEIVASIPVRWRLFPSYMHSFGLTKNYFVILEQPLTISVPNISINFLRNLPIINSLKSFPNELTQISVVSRNTGKRTHTFYSNTFFYFHTINQYEEENHIILDVCIYNDASLLESFKIDALRDRHNNYDMLRSTPVRLILPLLDSYDNVKPNENLVKIKKSNAKAFLREDGTIFVEWEVLSKSLCELPTVNYHKHQGVKYKYFYALGFDNDQGNFGSIIKVNTEDKTTIEWYEKYCFANEPIFVANPNAESEDDGVILSNFVWDCNETHRTGLIVLDAKTMEEIGRVEFDTPGPIPAGFHGCLTDSNTINTESAFARIFDGWIDQTPEVHEETYSVEESFEEDVEASHSQEDEEQDQIDVSEEQELSITESEEPVDDKEEYQQNLDEDEDEPGEIETQEYSTNDDNEVSSETAETKDETVEESKVLASVISREEPDEDEDKT